MANSENDAIRFRGHDRIRHGSDWRHIIDDDVKSLFELLIRAVIRFEFNNSEGFE